MAAPTRTGARAERRSGRPSLRDRLRWLSPRAELAVKTGLAAGLAWFLVSQGTRLLDLDRVDDYIYYAPFGAVVATLPTVVESVRVAWKAGLALLLGGLLGLGVHVLTEPGLLSLAVVVGLGVLLGSLPWLGEQSSWVPIVALFVVTIGGAHPTTYAGAYVALTAFGALCGVFVNLVLPTMPFREHREALDSLRERLASQLETLAEGLRETPPPDWEGWDQGRQDTVAALERTRRAVRELVEASRANARGWWHRGWMDRQRATVRALGRVAVLVDDLVSLLAQADRRDPAERALDPDVSTALGAAFEALAAVVRDYDPHLPGDDAQLVELGERLGELTELFSRRRDMDATDVAILGAVVANLRRSSAAVTPDGQALPATPPR